MLEALVILLAAAAIAVPLSRRAGFGSVLGYLVAGVAIGPSGLRLVTDVDQITRVSELGVIMLLFLIGLEVRPARLWVMRRAVFGLGSAQVAATAAALAWIAHLGGAPWAGAVVLGVGMAMSSTAIVLPMLGERALLATRAGRDGFAVLLFQDLAFIPLVALVPLLGGAAMPDQLPLLAVAKGAGAIAVILLGGRFLMGPAFRAIGGARTPEVFTTLALLIVAGSAALAGAAGLSPSLGAFMAGVLLSESEYRHELQADIEPFEGLLLGFFFVSVGMSAQVGLLAHQPVAIVLGVAVLLVAKAAVAYALARIARHDRVDAVRFALALPQGSEFSFVLFAAAIAVGALGRDQAEAATLVVALSMMATPLLFAASERLLIPPLRPRKDVRYDTIVTAPTPVIVCGFGRVGQIIGRILRMQGLPFTALEGDPAQLEVVRRFGSDVYFGDPTRPDLLRAAGADKAKLLVVAIDDMEAALRVVDTAQRNFPNLTIISRARNRRHVHLLLDRGITQVVRDTFYSSLKLSELVLRASGIPGKQAQRAVALFAEHDERNLIETHGFYRDEKQLIQSVQQAAEELSGLFEADQRREKEAGPG
ncbi:monovalent cation:proton antiporter-2 (CPA2) family protein [Limobrevibacterium gyesilva]|uniref:Monovalent cation:proton antiporter-2 (CPA2) family protein n=1 Tax=Limobrevibacterium gyesilva TaxID=2991712 RepID=A0AA41YLR9_9PROT|nr:monovalent cation:proton antiporter-2 (CPA2) family protein [Limobrevibacterium gyesilva]MCW3474283.1 monovalent cation:proton antiporter-2 (CPA2) family protein [Limobrevibacterium gyesilva]